MPLYRILKVGYSFKLKSFTSLSLVFNVVHRFTCPCDTGKTYIAMSSRHLVTKAREQLNQGFHFGGNFLKIYETGNFGENNQNKEIR